MCRSGLSAFGAALVFLVPIAGQAGLLLLPGAPLSGLSPGAQCRAAIDHAERVYGLPAHLLAAIGRVESGRANAAGGVDPWPYSIDVEGTDRVFDSKAAAIAAVRADLAAGARSIDVGCLQVNLMYHPHAFGSLEEAFDPWLNADAAARFLVQLHTETGSWAMATANYHSATPELGVPYAARVQLALAQETGLSTPLPTLPGAPAAAMARAPAGRPAPGAMVRTGVPSGRLPLPGVAGGGRDLQAYRNNPVRLAASLLRR